MIRSPMPVQLKVATAQTQSAKMSDKSIGNTAFSFKKVQVKGSS